MMRTLTLLFVMTTLSTHADMAVRAGPQGLEVGVDSSKITVFQPIPTEVWVVAPPGKLMGVDTQRTGWKVEKLQVPNGTGLKLTTPQPRTWNVTKQAGGWLVSIGTNSASPQTPSVIITREGLAGGLAVQDAQGTRFTVLPVENGNITAATSPALTATIHGVAMKSGAALVASTKPTSYFKMTEYKEKKQEPTTPKVSLPSIKTAQAPTLPKVATPTGTMAAMEEDLASISPAAGPEHNEAPAAEILHAAPDALGTYTPGTLVPFTLPEGYRLERGELRRESAAGIIEKRLEFARAFGSVTAATDKAASVAENVQGVLDAPAVEANLPSPLISSSSVLALKNSHDETSGSTAYDFDAAMAEPPLPASELFPPTGNRREYWTGLTVRLVKLNKAMTAAGAQIAVRAAPISAETSEKKPPEEPAAIEPHAGPAKEEKSAAPQEPYDPWVKAPEAVASNAAVIEARRNLVAYLMAWNRPHEALMESLRLPVREDGLPENAEDRLMYAMALTASQRGGEALPLLQADASTMPAHRAVWRAAALQQTGRNAEALRAWPTNAAEVLMTYAPDLRRTLMLSHGAALAAAGDKNDLKYFADTLAAEYPETAVPAAVTRLQGLSLIATRDEQRGMELLAQAAASTDDPESANKAKFDFVMALLRRNELEDRQVSSYLEELRMFWRGDELEQNVLLQLGETYLKQRNYRNALGRWQTLVKAYPNFPGMAALTDKMTTAVVGVFDPENPEQLDPLTFLGLYFDFKELLPSDTRGDYAMERAGRILSEQSLPDRAIPVLEQVLRYRAQDPIDKARVALTLADAYTRHNKADLALRTLDEHKQFAVNSIQQKNWPLAEARALLSLHRPQQALDALAQSTDEETPWLKSDAAWELQNWELLADILRPVVSRMAAETLPNNRANQVAVMRLAYAYGQQLKRPELETLLEKFGPTAREIPAMADTMAAIATQAGVAKVEDAARPLAQVAEALAGLNAYTDQFRQTQKQVQQRIDEREDYNNKMKFNELLPPPSF